MQGSDQIISVTQLCPTLCDPMNRSTPGLPVHHQLPEFTETHSQTLKRAVCPFLFFFLCTFKLFSGPLLFFFPGIMGRMCVCVCTRTHSVMSASLWPHGLLPTRLLCPWNFPGRSTGVGCHFCLQQIFPTQGLNLCLLHLLHWQADSLLRSHLGSNGFN